MNGKKRTVEKRRYGTKNRQELGYKKGRKRIREKAARRWRNRFPGSLNVCKLGLRARILKLVMSTGIDSKESVPPAYVALRAAGAGRR